MIRLFVAALVSFPSFAYAAGELKGIREIEVHVESQSPDGYSFGLTNDVFKKIVIDKLKTTGLTLSPGGNCPTLFVSVSTMKLPGDLFAYSYRVQLMESVVPEGRPLGADEKPPTIHNASTWSTSGMASTAKREFPKAIKTRLGDAVERFSIAYSTDNPKTISRR